MSKPLVPPDLKRCQAEIPTGDSFMTLGGRPGGMERCSSPPAFIVVEVKAGEDGQCGSMALCPGCYEVLCEQRGLQGLEVWRHTQRG